MKNRLSSALGMGLMALSKHAAAAENKIVDVVLIGGGIMSATLGTYLQELEPDWSINMYERLDSVADESSNGWNNAGTGHSALAEMNYTPEKADGSVEIAKAVEINEAFQISRQFWSYQVEKKVLGEPRSFITSVPHMSFVWGEKNVEFLRKRHAALQTSTLFRGMEFSEDRAQIEKWIPLVLEGRDPKEKVAATRIESGTDVNFGAITHQLVESLRKKPNFSLNLGHEVKNIKRNADKTWTVTFSKKGGREHSVTTRFIFIGAGGASLTLLQKSGIPEASRYGGFPVGGEFLVTDNPEIVKRHQAKVYGKASVGAPPMSVPHLDTRVLDGKKVLLFGPFATFSSKFLKNGSLWDLFGTVNLHNIFPMVRVGLDNFDLVKYLINQVMLTEEQRLAALKEYFPDAKKQDWRLVVAGQRVQIIEKDGKQGGVLRLGTEVVTSQDGSIAALLGASPGASTAAPIMLELMERVFKDKVATSEWQSKLKEMIPSYGQKLNGNVELAKREMDRTSRVLQLEIEAVKPAVVVQPVVHVQEEEAEQEEFTS
ncbi:malate:quinone oxidoreductase [Rouxiella badensis]|jgi:malate dehydrogenase (quinone)|uniref:Probable malate:quinone oxidoreductase n=1 Tax=Rouxiella badensis TaxID=1646377 RepID=A0A1X0W9W8_9GAMM|nr:malate:quinone oxidoreductase [Rouxiella badensis]MCC3702834.1 malate:quinone oxidoreductase [Rouxiella badensis]MCC3720161.1 malate:quinone oxidoreductase [Rouxiella badensis]MCC3729824.1 malate:quinone oxidoreductase [Rouxiella badensis]MCC3733992.1 malate:quinone oxidoreductase [Rouxiella badensis]MCC3741311.1 malate:quinone oxidoreductase [Rouxiella badensis]